MPTLAFCPCAPVLVPEVAQGAAPETADVLAACDAAVARLAQGDVPLVVVGAGPEQRVHDGRAVGTLAGFGVLLTVGDDPPGSVPAGRPSLPVSLTVGAWLLDRARVAADRRRYVEVSAGGSATVAAATLAGLDEGAGWLVMGDGTARLSERAPGGTDPRAVPFDAAVLDALGSGDPSALARLDPADGVDLMAAGIPAWRAVGSALLAADPARRWTATVTSHAAPYGVSYVVATWD